MGKPGIEGLTPHLAEALFTVDLDTGEVLDCNETAARLLGREVADIRGSSWLDVVDSPPASLSHFLQAAQVGHRVALPPFILLGAGGAERVVAGMFMRSDQAAGNSVNMLLWPVVEQGVDLAAGPSDVIAVLAVDRLRYGPGWSAGQTSTLMRDIQARLAEIIRTQDTLALTSASGCALVLRDVDTQSAADICRALLSHLHRALDHSEEDAGNHRFCVGLAPVHEGRGSLSCLVSASHALALAQHGSTADEPIRIAGEEDGALLAGEALASGGVFQPASDGGDYMPDGGLSEDSQGAEAPPLPVISPIEKNIEGYVVDNMEGAVDQALFMAELDVPISIVGPAGTGKMYIARIIHEQWGGEPDLVVPLDCREFRSRNSAGAAISKELARAGGRTLVFKSPHLMHQEVQVKLARQIATRTRTDVSPPEYLPRVKLIALFPDSLEVLVRRGGLTEQLASVFAGYPIRVPAIKDRKQAVLRWAHKILGQEGVSRDRDMKGFTPDAERAMLNYDWPGNISEMRQLIRDALEKTDKGWLTPVDLGLFKGISPDGAPYLAEPRAFLSLVEEEVEEESYVPSSMESVDLALGETVHNVLELNLLKPLGSWLEDDMVLAALDRYRGDVPRAAAFLHTRSRNISRWLPKIESREDERSTSSLWQHPRRLLWDWVRETGQLEDSPLQVMQDKLMAHVNEQAGDLSAAKRARIMGVSTPTFLKRIRELEENA